MRVLGLTMCFFVCLTLSSTIFYFYLLISQYMKSKAFESHKRIVGDIVSYVQPAKTRKPTLRPYNTRTSGKEELKREKVLQNQIRHYKDQLLMKLRTYEMDATNVLFHPEKENRYGVRFKGRKGSRYPSISSLCRISFDIINKTNQVFRDNGYYNYFPDETIWETLKTRKKKANSCALVTNAGSLMNSHMGAEIDASDIVLRFNDAPTVGHERDVGRKTTIRILNSQVVAAKKFNISHSLYRDTVNIVWDPANYGADLMRWFASPDHPFFAHYKEARTEHPEVPFFLLHPATIWRAWDALQDITFQPLPKTPPSSGFLGLLLLIKLCANIRAYEYVPSIRVTPFCHYYDNSSSFGCTFGEWHPLATEKLFALRLNHATDFDTVVRGTVAITGCAFL